MTVPNLPKKRNRWLLPTLIGGGVLILLCFCGGATALIGASNPGNISDSATPNLTKPSKSAPKPDDPKTYNIGQPVRGGDFEFVVHNVKCEINQVGDSFLSHKAQGMFCRIDVSAKNVTKSAQLFHADGTVTAQDEGDREYSADGTAGIYGNKDSAGFLTEINPGNSVRAFVYFDVTKGTKLKTITFDAGLLTLAEDAIVTL